jgi:hypothetical protein
MRRHAPAVVLLSGWLLMLPFLWPAPQATWEINPEGVMTGKDWRQHRAFDTAKDCEEAKDKLIAESHRNLHNHEVEVDEADGYMRFKDISDRETAETAAHTFARCVPAESIYPPPCADK